MKRLWLKPCIVLKYLVFIDFPVWVFKAVIQITPPPPSNENVGCVSQAFSAIFGSAVAVSLENTLPHPSG